MVSLRDAVNSLFHESFVRPAGSLLTGAGPGALPLDVVETENEFTVKASLPGLKPEDIHTSIVGDTLTIRGETRSDEEKKGQNWVLRERRAGAFHRSVALHARVNADKATAHFEDGVLTLTLPKAEAAKPKQIKISGR
jgi:HSP20 family protein